VGEVERERREKARAVGKNKKGGEWMNTTELKKLERKKKNTPPLSLSTSPAPA
jgi:hypothetical protein